VTSEVRTATGEWAVLAGLMSVTEARTIAGLYGLSSVPVLGNLFKTQTKEDDERTVLILIRPRVIGVPPEERTVETIWVGPESRLNVPLY
jgi:type II secretory pathway component GspD/PulD (secretin)